MVSDERGSFLLELQFARDSREIARWGFAAAPIGSPLCFGDGTGAACPCSNPGMSGEGCANSGGRGASLSACGSASVADDDILFAATRLPANQPVLLIAGLASVNGGNGSPFGDGLTCVAREVRKLGVRFADAEGAACWGPGLQALGGWDAGSTRYFQAWYRDPLGSPCGSLFNLSNALEVDFGS